MSENSPNRLAAVRKRHKLTQQELAEKVDAHWITISKLERGKMKLTFEWASKISKALNLDIFELYENEEAKRVISASGLIVRGSRLKFLDEYSGFMGFTIDIGFAEGEDTQWFYVDTDELYPSFQNGDLLRVRRVSDWPCTNVLNRLCAVTTGGEKPDHLIGILNPSSTPERYDIRRLSGMPTHGVEVIAVWLVTMAVYSPNAGGRPGYYYGQNEPNSQGE